LLKLLLPLLKPPPLLRLLTLPLRLTLLLRLLTLPLLSNSARRQKSRPVGRLFLRPVVLSALILRALHCCIRAWVIQAIA